MSSDIIEPGKAPEAQSEPDMSSLDRWIEKGGKIFSFLFMVSGIVIVFEVVARYAFRAPTIWGHETTILLCALCFAYGGSYCLAKDSHIRIVVVYDKVSPRVRRYLDFFINGMGVIWGGFLVWAAWTLVEKSWFAPWGDLRLETTGSAWDPPHPAWIKAFLMLALVVMTVQYALKLIQLLRHR